MNWYVAQQCLISSAIRNIVGIACYFNGTIKHPEIQQNIQIQIQNNKLMNPTRKET